MDKEYWEGYYSSANLTENPSGFAEFCASQYAVDCGHIFDIGCGNGRDTFYFSRMSIPVSGIEQCEVAVAENLEKKSIILSNANFHQGDFSSCNYDGLVDGPYSIYSRFTLHAINYTEEERLFSHLNQVKNLRYIFIEARSIRDGLYGQGTEVGPHEYVSSHYRRFIDPVELKNKLSARFDVVYFAESQGFAKTDTEDPCLIRLIAKRR